MLLGRCKPFGYKVFVGIRSDVALDKLLMPETSVTADNTDALGSCDERAGDVGLILDRFVRINAGLYQIGFSCVQTECPTVCARGQTTGFINGYLCAVKGCNHQNLCRGWCLLGVIVVLARRLNVTNGLTFPRCREILAPPRPDRYRREGRTAEACCHVGIDYYRRF